MAGQNFAGGFLARRAFRPILLRLQVGLISAAALLSDMHVSPTTVNLHHFAGPP